MLLLEKMRSRIRHLRNASKGFASPEIGGDLRSGDCHQISFNSTEIYSFRHPKHNNGYNLKGKNITDKGLTAILNEKRVLDGKMFERELRVLLDYEKTSDPNRYRQWLFSRRIMKPLSIPIHPLVQ